MSTEMLEIVDPGMLTTVQDTGRVGYQRFGVPVSGALDTFALRAANIIVGNDENDGALEFTVMGPRIKFMADTLIALTGADLNPSIDGESITMWQVVGVFSGSILSFKGMRDGMRGYLAIAGGIDTPPVMGSRATYVKAELGGLEGRALKAGDSLSAKDFDTSKAHLVARIPKNFRVPTYGHEHEIRIVLGPQDAAFTANAVSTFLTSTYSVSMQSDRMGYRLEGPTIEHVSGPDIVSDGMPLGAIQIPGDGQPIILLVDRGTTGGYTKIATVISSDIGKIAQAMPGDSITFKKVTLDESVAIRRDMEAALQTLRDEAKSPEGPRHLSIVVDGEAFEVVDERGQKIALSELSGDDEGWTHHAKATVGGHTYEFEVKVHPLD